MKRVLTLFLLSMLIVLEACVPSQQVVSPTATAIGSILPTPIPPPTTALPTLVYYPTPTVPPVTPVGTIVEVGFNVKGWT